MFILIGISSVLVSILHPSDNWNTCLLFLFYKLLFILVKTENSKQIPDTFYRMQHAFQSTTLKNKEIFVTCYESCYLLDNGITL
jgi:hypothetical protein